jgi:hypothetical protein
VGVTIVAGLLTQSPGAFAPLAVGGPALIARGGLVAADVNDIRDGLTERERAGWRGRIGLHAETRATGIALVLIGIAWLAMGIRGVIALLA